MRNRLAWLLALAVGCLVVTLLVRVHDSDHSRPAARQEKLNPPVFGCLSVPDWEWMQALISASVSQAVVCLLESGSVVVTKRSPVLSGRKEGGQEGGTKWLVEVATGAEEQLKRIGVSTELPPESLILSPGFLSVVALLLVGYVYFLVKKP